MRDIKFMVEQLRKVAKKGDFAQAREYSARIAKELKSEADLPSVLLTPQKVQILPMLVQQLSACQAAAAEKDIARVIRALDRVDALFNNLFSNTVVYLIRHPEKTAEPGRNITPAGVKFARQYALNLINEIKLCPKNVNVMMYVSEISRTQAFANVVAYELKKLAELEGRTVGVLQKGFDKRLSFRFTKNDLDVMGEYAKEKNIKSGSFEQFVDWYNNPQSYVKMSEVARNPQGIAAELMDFVDVKRREHTASENTWSIVLGFSHSWILDSLRMAITGGKVKSLIESAGEKESRAGFLKADGNQITVDNKWYSFAPKPAWMPT